MRKLLTIFFIFTFMGIAVAEEGKIGFIDMQRTLNESLAGKAAKSELEGMVKKRQTVIDGKISAREKLVADLEKQSVVLSADARRKKQDELERLTRDVERMIADSNAELQKSQREKEVRIFKDMDKVISDIGKKGGYSVILPVDVVLYAPKAINLTDKLIKAFDKFYKEKSKK